MTAILSYDTVIFLIDIVCRKGILTNSQRPLRQLHLKIETLLVCHLECRFRRTPRMETEMIQSVFFRCGKHFLPTRLICRRRAGKWENATFKRASQKHRLIIYQNICTLGTNFPETKIHTLLCSG